MKTVVQPKLLASYMMETTSVPQMGAPISVPILCLPGVDDDEHHGDAEPIHIEEGAAGMLQVSKLVYHYTSVNLVNCDAVM